MPEDKVVMNVDYGAEGIKKETIKAPSNSNKRKIEAIAKGEPRKESLAGKIFSEFIQTDLKTVADSAINEILIPYAKDALLDVLHDSIDMIFGGGGRRARASKGPTYVSYGAYYKQDGRTTERRADRRAGYDFKEIVFKTRVEAEEVIERMYDLLENDGSVTVADFYSLAGIHSAYTDETYGWTNLRSAMVQKIRDGYIVSLPKPKLL